MARKLAGEWLCAWSEARSGAYLALGFHARAVALMNKSVDIIGYSIHCDPPATLREQAERSRIWAEAAAVSPAFSGQLRLIESNTSLALAAIFDLAASEAEETQPKGS